MLRFIILALMPCCGWGQGKPPGIISAEKFLITSPQKAAAIARGIFAASQAKPDYYSTVYSSLLLSTVHRQAGYYLQALYYDSVALLHARYSNDTLLLQKAVNSYAASMVGAGKIQQAEAILNYYRNLFDDKGNAEECRWYTLNGTCHLKQMQYDSAFASYRKGILVGSSIRDTSSVMFLKMMLGKAYVTRMQFDSLSLVHEALSYFEATGNYVNAAHAASNLGLAYKLSFNPELALTYFIKAYNYSVMANSPADREDIRMHMGEMYQAQKKYEMARETITASHTAFKKMNMRYYVSMSATKLGELYTETGQYDSAMYYLNYAEKMAKPFNNNLLMAAVIGGKLKLAIKQTDARGVDSLGKIVFALLWKKIDKEVVNAASKRLMDGTLFLSKDIQAAKALQLAQLQQSRVKDSSVLTVLEIQRLSRMNQLSGSGTDEDTTLLARTNRQLIQTETSFKVQKITDSLQTQEQQRLIDKQEIKLAGNKLLIAAGLLLFVSAGLWLQYKNRRRAERDKQKIELLQNEIHHRVKNNLAVLNRVVEIAGKDHMENIPAVALKNRIKSIELLHQHLYNNEAKTGNISLQAYFTDLCAAIAATFETTKPIFITVNATVEVDSHIAEKLGLIINELVTNSFKYAFAERETGAITIMAEQEKTQLYLVVKDNGIGMQAGKNARSYGMKLIKGLSNELDGRFAFESVEGTVFKLAIPFSS